MQNAIYLGMKFKKEKKPLTREKVLSLIKGKLPNAKILYATKEELIEILLDERREKFLSEYEKLNNQTQDEKIEEISDFIKFIAQKLDEKQAIIALQTGLSLLNKSSVKNRSLLLVICPSAISFVITGDLMKVNAIIEIATKNMTLVAILIKKRLVEKSTGCLPFNNFVLLNCTY